MANISDYSTQQQKVIKEIVSNDKGFHSTYLIADTPFYGMLEELDNGETFVKTSVSCPLSSSNAEYELQLNYSQEQNCWFYVLKYLGEEIRGIVHYNTVVNAMGELSFAILNDNTDSSDLTPSLPYSNVLVLRK